MAVHSPAFVRLVDAARAKIRQCTVDDLKARLDGGAVPGRDFVLIDTREESEFAVDHIAGSIHLSKGIIERDIEVAVPDVNTEVLLVCGGGYRSALAAVNLQEMGYTNVVSVDGGMRGWRAAGHPVVAGAAQQP